LVIRIEVELEVVINNPSY